MGNIFKTAILLGVLTSLVVLIGGGLGGQQGMLVAFVLAAVMNFGAYWFSDKIVLAMSGAQPVDEAQAPGLHRIVRTLATRAGLPMPRVYLIPGDAPNAFATGRNPEHASVAVTAGILQALSWDELRGVLAHEMSHVGNRDILISSVAATVAMAITLLARMAAFAAIFGGGDRRDEGEGGLEVLALAILAPLAAGLLQLALSRSREYQADASGAALIGDGEPLARALEKLDRTSQQIPMPTARPEMAALYIVNPLTRRQVSFGRWFSDHPPTADRIARLRSRRWAA